jgi:uroporphyrinogen-III synthase
MSLEHRTIALAEGRQLEELAQLLEKEGAQTVRCPMLSILDPPDDSAVVAWLRRLCADEFAWVVLLTGEGVRRLVGSAGRHDLRDQVVAALGRTRLVVRGPKPVKALKELNLAPTLVASVPTTDGVIAALRDVDLRGLTVGVQLYNDSNQPLTDFLQQASARAVTVLPYVYAPAADAERVAAVIGQLAAGDIDAIVFTSSPQVDRLFEVAQQQGLTEALRHGFTQTQVASVGPVLSENLERHGVHVNVCPEQGFVMKNLVQLLKRALGPKT